MDHMACRRTLEQKEEENLFDSCTHPLTFAESLFKMITLRLLTSLIAPFLALTGAASSGGSTSRYAVKTPPLTTDYTYSVGTNPWTEYPRPQLTRPLWQSLNGVWTYRNASSYEEISNVPTGDLGAPVLVPSCLESGLSGS